MRKQGLFFFFFLFFSTAASSAEFKLLTWNVYMLPKPIKFSQQKIRTRLISQQLQKLDHDLVVLQEAFTCPFQKKLARDLAGKYPFQKTLGKSGRWSQVMNSGVMILSRYPVTVLGHEFYQSCGRADCYASKGVLLVRVDLPGKSVQVAVTHLQSGEGNDIVAVRTSQVAQVKRLLDKHRQEGVAQILAGDLNLDALKKNEFAAALTFLSMENSPLLGDLQSTKSTIVDCLGKSPTDEVSWIDHVLLDSNGSGIDLIDKRVKPIQDYVKGSWCDLSDHLAVEATLSINI